MKLAPLLAIVILTTATLSACSEPQAPTDSNGKTPQQVMLETYTLITEGQYDQARAHFSPAYIEELITSKGLTFEQFHTNEQGIDVRQWQTQWLKTTLVGNDYNDDVWRVKLIVDQGKGAENPPGVVHDLHIIDGAWKIVFWGHYPKS